MIQSNKDKILKHYLKEHPKTSRRKLQVLFPWLKVHLTKGYKNSLKIWCEKNKSKLPNAHYIKNVIHSLTEKHITILRFLLEQRLAITPQINFLLNTGEKVSTTYDTLYRLMNFGYLSFVDGYKYHLWEITTEGKRALLDCIDKVNERFFLKNITAGSNDVDHDLLVNDVRLVLTRYFGPRLLRWYSDSQIRKYDIYHGFKKLTGLSKTKSKNTGITKFHYPDGMIEFLDQKGKRRLAFIEMERSHKNVADYTKILDQNVSNYYSIVEPRIKQDHTVIYDGQKLDPIDYYFYILGPHSSALPMWLNARRKVNQRILEGKNWYCRINPIDYRRNVKCCEMAKIYHNVASDSLSCLPKQLRTTRDYIAVFKRLPFLVARNDYEISKVEIFIWDDKKRPRNESKLYRENKVYRDLVDKYDPANSFMDFFGVDSNGQRYSLDWIKKYRTPKKRGRQ